MFKLAHQLSTHAGHTTYLILISDTNVLFYMTIKKNSPKPNGQKTKYLRMHNVIGDNNPDNEEPCMRGLATCGFHFSGLSHSKASQGCCTSLLLFSQHTL